MNRQFYVYIMASKKDGVLYVGMTNDLARRGDEHKSQAVKGFTQKYWVKRLVYYESYNSPADAVQREKNIKAWQRAWKIRLIEETNPEWKDLSYILLD